MNIVSDINSWRDLRHQLAGKSIGFVPTMGHLHAGHANLCERAKKENEITIVSIFVNPTQFNELADFEKYPRTIPQDQKLLTDMGVDYLFLPTQQALYPDQFQIKVTEDELSRSLEGEHRPGHFCGMLTIVLKLLNLVQATRAYFGEKDFQQLLLIKKMVSAFFIPTDIVACETVRAADGLALSSRNSRLNATQRLQASQFPALLKNSSSTKQTKELLTALGFKVDYIAEEWGRRLGAVWLDEIRLIDNVKIEGKIS